MSTSTYLLEKLPNLKQLKVFIQPRFHPDRYQLSIEDKFVWFIRKDKKADALKICFDCKVNPDQTSCTIKDRTVYLTLPIVQDEFNDESDDFPTANELALSNYSLLKCRFCENTIYNHCDDGYGTLEKIYPLPSEYWLELSDMWFCCSSHQIDFNAKEIRGKVNHLLVGKLHFILHSLNVKRDALRLSPRTVADEYSVDTLAQSEQQRMDKRKREKNQSHRGHCNHGNHDNGDHHDHDMKEEGDDINTEKVDNHHHHDHDHNDNVNHHDDDDKDENVMSWDGVLAFNVHCCRCDTLLGLSYQSKESIDADDVAMSDTERLNEYHFWKFEVSTEGRYQIPFSRNVSPSDSVYHWYCVENYFSTKMVETKKARTVHKFLVHDMEHRVFLRLNLLSDKCFIKCPHIGSDAETQSLAPILRLQFADWSHVSYQENMQWIEQRKGHWITSSTENCRILLQCLKKHNSYYPKDIATQRFPDEMKLTFLRLLSRTWTERSTADMDEKKECRKHRVELKRRLQSTTDFGPPAKKLKTANGVSDISRRLTECDL